MLEWLFGKKEQGHQVNCAMCDINLTVTLATDLQPSAYGYNLQKFTEMDCPFCKTALAIVRDSDGIFSTADIKWDIETAEYDEQESSLSDKITDLEDIIDDEDSTQDETGQAKKDLKPLMIKL
ncbi:hypothetical protein BMS3Bbin08_00074 [bacterium BMS3Bbin08]|nr:hypothetical protein BMS3Bbin08_00074 [bacterium BMS3Bbin08]